MRDLPVGLKLAVAPAQVALGLLVVSAAGFRGNAHTRGAGTDLAEHGLPHIANVGQINERVANLNGMVMQSLAYEGIGLEAETIEALDKRTTKATNRSLAAVAILVSGPVSMWFSRLIVAPLTEAVHVAKEVAAGNLGEQPAARGRDVTGQVLTALGEVPTHLNQVMLGIRDAARDIKALIADSVQQIDERANIVQQAGESMQRIVESARSVSAMIEQIASTASAQSHELDSVKGAVGEMDQSTQQYAARVEQAAAATLSLKPQVEGLGRAISVFRIG